MPTQTINGGFHYSIFWIIVSLLKSVIFVHDYNLSRSYTRFKKKNPLFFRKQETIATEREEIERQRKLLGKRKPSTAQPKGRANNGTAVALPNGDFAKPDPPKE